MDDYLGIIIEESLSDKSILKELEILDTEIHKVTKESRTPWLSVWTLHTIQVREEEMESAAKKISAALDQIRSNWYADFKNSRFHYIIFSKKIFKVDRTIKDGYKAVTQYGLTLGIPAYLLDFSQDIR